jgi:hypothetical protein
MTVSKLKILLPKSTDKVIDIPIEMTWDFGDRTNDMVEYEKAAVKEVLNEDKDFEVARFAFANNVNIIGSPMDTSINYEFYFAPSGATSANTIWNSSYITQGFTPQEIFYYANPFKKSFFKVDLYDSTNQKDQTNYITLIIPTQQGLTTGATVGWSVQQIKRPAFNLDFLGDKEGFFIYWLKKRDFLNINTFYMSVKFFDAKNGYFIKMMNRPQSSLSGISKFNFNQDLFFYYKVVLDYSNYTYKVYDINSGVDVEVGHKISPIKWYEYINP